MFTKLSAQVYVLHVVPQTLHGTPTYKQTGKYDVMEAIFNFLDETKIIVKIRPILHVDVDVRVFTFEIVGNFKTGQYSLFIITVRMSRLDDYLGNPIRLKKSLNTVTEQPTRT